MRAGDDDQRRLSLNYSMMTTKLLSFALGATVSVAALAGNGFSDEQQPLYLCATAPIERRVDDLMSRMTLREKVNQLQNRYAGEDFRGLFGDDGIGTVHEMNLSAEDCAIRYKNMQSYLLQQTRLGIPALTCAEGIQGIIQNGCTLYPHALAQGATWNPELIKRMTMAAGDEAMQIGIHQILSPVLDLGRELRWGRVEETFGEDPFLVAEMATAFVNGYQHHPSITCTPKHFVAHGTPQGGLNCAEVKGGPRDLWSLYLYPFKKVIERTHPQAVMSCYSAYDGVPVTASHYYMTEVLRDSLGFDGYVYSDWGAVERLKDVHHAVATREEAARIALMAGVDLDIDDSYQSLVEQVEQGLVSMVDIDRAVRRILSVKFRLGLFDTSLETEPFHMVRNHKMAREVANESAILLQNNGILPLDTRQCRRIAVIGPNADCAVMGDYSWTSEDSREGVTLLQGISEATKGKCQVSYARGCDWWSQDTTQIAQAVAIAQQSDVAVVAIGTRSTYLGRDPKKSTSGEGFDLSAIELPGVQQRLLEAVKATGKPMVVVLISGKPLAIPWVKENVDALLVQWYAGEEQGHAAADILLGRVNPSGRLNVSFPRSTGTLPCYYNYNITERENPWDKAGDINEPGRRYVFDSPEPLWCFGEGMSYTTFEYSDMNLSTDTLNRCDTLDVCVTVRNTGLRDGKEVVQLYVRDLVSSVATPKQQLRAFQKVDVKAGQTCRVTLRLPIDELALYNEKMQRVVEPGDFELQVGSSAGRIHLRKMITVR